MPNLPAIVKSYEFDPNRVVGGGAETTTMAELWYQFATTMTNGVTFTTPCICRGSSDAVTSGMDDTNRWTDNTKSATYSAGAHSWIVLEFPGITYTGGANPLQVLFSRDSATIGNATIVISQGAGFGTANGGTDGSASVNPSATDQWVPFRQQSLIGAGNLPNLVQTITMSTDGAIVRCLFSGDTTARRRWLSFEVPKNPIDEWVRPFMFICLGHTTSSDPFATPGAWWNAATGTLTHACIAPYAEEAGYGYNNWTSFAVGNADEVADFCPVFLRAACGANVSNSIATTYAAVHSVSGGYTIGDIYVIGENYNSSLSVLGGEGYFGMMEDCYVIGTGSSIGDALPSTGEKLWWCCGSVIIPGPNDSATDIVL